MDRFKYILNTKFMSRGAPLIALCLSGAIILRQFNNIRFEYFSNERVRKEDLEKCGFKLKPDAEVTLEKIYENIQTIDIDNWHQVRGPRPWEENQNEAKE